MDSVKKKFAMHVTLHGEPRVIRKRSKSLGIEFYERLKNPVQSNVECVSTASFIHQKCYRPVSTTSCPSVSDSDSQSDSGLGYVLQNTSPITHVRPVFTFNGYQNEGSPVPYQLLPPIGVFWDIENCQVPRGKSAVAVAQVIRQKFFTGFREAEFLAVCDVTKENTQVLQDLNDAQVNLIHVASVCKNAADDKLRQSMRRFADIYGSAATILLISGDINFVADITDLRHRKKINVILLHQGNTSENLILCASEHYSFTELVERLPFRTPNKFSGQQPFEVTIFNLPYDRDQNSVRTRLRQLSNNCGGRVTSVRGNLATIRFMSLDAACRAQKRMEGEDVFGRKIHVSRPNKIYGTERGTYSYMHAGNYQGRKLHATEQSDVPCTEMPSHASLAYQQTSTPISLQSSGIWPLAHQRTPFGSWNAFGGGVASVNFMQESFPNICSEMQISSDFPGNFSNHFSSHGVNDLSASRYSRRFATRLSKDRFVEGFPGIHTLQKDKQPVTKSVSVMTETIKSSDSVNDISGIISNGNKKHTTFNPSNVSSLSENMFETSSNVLSYKSSNSQLSDLLSSKQSDGYCESESYFQPIGSLPDINSFSDSSSVELHVNNIDNTLGARKVKETLLKAFKEHVPVLNLSVVNHADGSLIALVRLRNSQDAQYAVSKLQKRKIGHKRINIFRNIVNGPNPNIVRSQVFNLLSNVPNHTLPLLKFCEIYERRYLCFLSLSDIAKLKDICHVEETENGRIISLSNDCQNIPSSFVSSQETASEQPFCPHHHKVLPLNKGWAEQEMEVLPSVNIGLKLLTFRVKAMLHSHNGIIHLKSFPVCYQAQFEPLKKDKNGVPLEHLVSCVAGVEILTSISNIKYIRWSQGDSSQNKTAEEDIEKNTSPYLASQVAGFNRELMELLKASPRCQLSFHKFIPAYHHHFGRQCRVATYGFTRLIELLEALPSTVQVLGEGNRRIITLTHKCQLRRFVADLFRIVRAQVNKQILLSQLPEAYEEVIKKPLSVVDYGVCDIEDLIYDIPEGSVTVKPVENSDDVLIAIPMRAQTPEEILKMKQFAAEVVELLRLVPNCCMPFEKFIPAHHIHFRRQCRVSDYGFVKLRDLFEAIPDVVQVKTEDGERWIYLTRNEHLNVLASQLSALFKQCSSTELPLSVLLTKYNSEFGYSINPESYGCSNVEEVLALISNTVKLQVIDECPVVVLVNLKMMVYSALSKENNYTMEYETLLKSISHNQNVDLEEIKQIEGIEVIEDEDTVHVQLKPLQRLGYEIYLLVQQAGGTISMRELTDKFQQQIEHSFLVRKLGFSTLEELVLSLSTFVHLHRSEDECYVTVQDHFVPGHKCTNTYTDHCSTGSNNISNGTLVNGDHHVSESSTIIPAAEGTSSRDSTISTHSDTARDIDNISEITQSSESKPEVCSTPVKVKSRDTCDGLSPVWCVESPPPFHQLEGPWTYGTTYLPSADILASYDKMMAGQSDSNEQLRSTSSLSNEQLLPTSSPLPPWYSYPPFLPVYAASPDPNTLPRPNTRLSAGPQNPKWETSAPEDGRNSNSSHGSTSKTKVKRRLAAQFHMPLDST